MLIHNRISHFISAEHRIEILKFQVQDRLQRRRRISIELKKNVTTGLFANKCNIAFIDMLATILKNK